MRSPAPFAPTSAAGIVIVAFVALAALAAAALFLLQSATRAVPAEVLDGLTSPASFGPRTT